MDIQYNLYMYIYIYEKTGVLSAPESIFTLMLVIYTLSRDLRGHEVLRMNFTVSNPFDHILSGYKMTIHICI